MTVSLNVPLAALNELMFPRPPPTRYSLGVAGQTTCPTGTSVVDSEADCKAVAASMGCESPEEYCDGLGYCDPPHCRYEGVQNWYECDNPLFSVGHACATSPGCHFRNGSRQSVFFNPQEDFSPPYTVVNSSGPICYWP